MSSETHYTQTDSVAKAEAAISDCKQYLGDRTFSELVALLEADKGLSTREQVIAGLAMLGVHGFPAQAVINRYWASH